MSWILATPLGNGDLQRSNGVVVEPNAFRVGLARRSENFSPNQYAEAVVDSFDSAGVDSASIIVRAQGAASTSQYFTGYVLGRLKTGLTAVISRLLSNGSTVFIGDTGVVFSQGDTAGISVIGNTLQAYRNGALAGPAFTDSTLSAGTPGFIIDRGNGGSVSPTIARFRCYNTVAPSSFIAPRSLERPTFEVYDWQPAAVGGTVYNSAVSLLASSAYGPSSQATLSSASSFPATSGWATTAGFNISALLSAAVTAGYVPAPALAISPSLSLPATSGFVQSAGLSMGASVSAGVTAGWSEENTGASIPTSLSLASTLSFSDSALNAISSQLSMSATMLTDLIASAAMGGTTSLSATAAQAVLGKLDITALETLSTSLAALFSLDANAYSEAVSLAALSHLTGSSVLSAQANATAAVHAAVNAFSVNIIQSAIAASTTASATASGGVAIPVSSSLGVTAHDSEVVDHTVLGSLLVLASLGFAPSALATLAAAAQLSSAATVSADAQMITNAVTSLTVANHLLARYGSNNKHIRFLAESLRRSALADLGFTLPGSITDESLDN